MALAIDPRQNPIHTLGPGPRPVELRLIPGGRSLRPTAATYRRRRLAVGLVALLLLIAGGLVVRATLGELGGVPASAPAARPAVAIPADGASDGGYVAQPGDTLWSIAQRFHGQHDLTGFVDDLVELNGGAGLVPGQPVRLPG